VEKIEERIVHRALAIASIMRTIRALNRLILSFFTYEDERQ